jgi:large conductance mechanosensitive channel
MGMLKEFRDFAMRGNVIDLAVGVIIGAAFGKIVSSLVEDIITPAILQPLLKAAHVVKLEDWAVNSMLVGKFISSVLSFILISFVLFLIIKVFNTALKKKEEKAPEVPTPEDILLLREIRDALKK